MIHMADAFIAENSETMDSTNKDRPVTTEELIIKLFSVDAVKFGDFTLKSGMQSPIYFDLRVMISHPQVMVDVANLLWEKIKDCKFQSFCGVPYTALPIATLMSVYHDVPMLIRRKEAKGYGTKKLIEGKFEDGDVCMIVEDVVSSGSSVMETTKSLEEAGIKVTDAVVLLNREQGGPEKLTANGITLHSIFTMSDVLSVLGKAGKLDPEMIAKVRHYINTNTFKPDAQMLSAPTPTAPKRSSYISRASQCSHDVSRRLLELMEEKHSNLVLSADVPKCQELLELVDVVGPHVVMVKTHADIMEDFTMDFVAQLQDLAKKHKFLIFEDRKFADIGNTVAHQLSGGVHKISTWADVINAHSVSGPGVVQGLQQAAKGTKCACLLIAEMSTSGSLATGDYTQATVKMAEDHPDFVMGFICQSRLSQSPYVLHMTPGVQLKEGTDSLGQRYLTPQEVICNRGCDLIIVGRGIYAASDSAAAAKQFQLAGYKAYLDTQS